MKKYILAITLLASLSSNNILASNKIHQINYSSNAEKDLSALVFGSHKTTLNAMDTDSNLLTFDPIRIITQPELEGDVSINLYLNQQLAMPITYTEKYLSNNIELGISTGDGKILNAVIESAASDSSLPSIFDINILCTARSIGATTLSFCDNGTVVRTWTVNVLDPNIAE